MSTSIEKPPELESRISGVGIAVGIIAVVLTALLMTIGNVQFLMWGAISVYWEWYPGVACLNSVVGTTVTFIIFLLAGLVASARGKLPGKGDLVFITSAVTLVVAMTSGMILLRQYYYWAAALGINPSLYEYMPSLFAPRNLDPWIKGGIMNWADWIPVIAIYLAMTMAWSFMLLFLVSIWRFLYIDIQRVPFPAAPPYLEQLEMLTTTGSQRPTFISFKGRARIFWVGFIVGAIFALPDIIAVVVPGFPSIIYSSAVAIVDWTPILGSSVRGMSMMVARNPFNVVLALLVPLDLSLSVWFSAFLADIIIGPVAAALGSPWAPGYGGWSVWDSTIDWLQMTGNGILVGLFIVPLILYRDRFLSTLKAAFTRKPAGVDESKEVMSYRKMYIGFIISAIVFTALGLIYSQAIVALIVITILTIIFTIAVIYTTGETNLGFPLMSEFYLSGPLINDILVATGTSSRDAFYPAVGAIHWAGYESTYVNPGLFQAFTYRMSDSLRVHPKVAFIGGTIGIIIGGIIGWPLTVWAINAFGGAARLGTAWIYSAWGGRGADYISGGVFHKTAADRGCPPNELYGGLVAGIIIAFIFGIMRMRYPWFPFSSAGFAMGWGVFGQTHLLEFLVGWAIKFIVVRFGGARVHDKYLIPLAAGWIVGITVFEFSPHVYYFVRAFAAV